MHASYPAVVIQFLLSLVIQLMRKQWQRRENKNINLKAGRIVHVINPHKEFDESKVLESKNQLMQDLIISKSFDILTKIRFYIK